MKTPCPHCGNAEVELFEKCPECQKTCMPGDIARPIEQLLRQLRECPECRQRAFDGWKCHKCGASISEKAKKAQGCILIGEKEIALVTRYFNSN